MPNISNQIPIQTPDGRVLLPAGSLVNEDAISSLVEPRKAAAPAYSLSRYGPYHSDTRHFLGSKPYHQIFSTPERLATVLSGMERITLPVTVLDTLKLFKERDFYTYRHFCMVFALSTLISRDLAMEDKDAFHLAATGPTHDIGKICIPPPILQKRTPLAHEERNVLNEHSVAGYVLLRYFMRGENTLGAKVALEHHERRDRSGFPRGIRLSDPMVEVIAVCDIYDALISSRPYRAVPYDNRAALDELCRMAEGGKIGWETVRLLIAYNRKSRPPHRDVRISVEKRGTPPDNNNYGVFSD